MNSAIVVFTRSGSRETKRFGFGQITDRRIAQFLVLRTLTCAQHCSDVADVIVIDETQQRGLTFGERLTTAVQDVRQMGYDRIVLIGSDTPGLTESDLRAAISSTCPIIGPSKDGGFYLFGFNQNEHHHLDGLSWQTDNVLAQLKSGLHTYTLLSYRRDLDDAIDAASTAKLGQLFFETVGEYLIETSAIESVLERKIDRLSLKDITSRGPPKIVFY